MQAGQGIHLSFLFQVFLLKFSTLFITPRIFIKPLCRSCTVQRRVYPNNFLPFYTWSIQPLTCQNELILSGDFIFKPFFGYISFKFKILISPSAHSQESYPPTLNKRGLNYDLRWQKMPLKFVYCLLLPAASFYRKKTFFYKCHNLFEKHYLIAIAVSKKYSDYHVATPLIWTDISQSYNIFATT